MVDQRSDQIKDPVAVDIVTQVNSRVGPVKSLLEGGAGRVEQRGHERGPQVAVADSERKRPGEEER